MFSSYNVVRSIGVQFVKRVGVKVSNLLKRRVTNLNAPIFIWGVGRSGTHLLYDILSLHPELTSLSVKSRMTKGLWGDMHWGSLVPEKLKGREIPIEGVKNFWNDSGFQFDGIGMYDRNEISEDIAKAVRSKYADLNKIWLWKPRADFRLLDKAPGYILMVDVIDALFPDSFHIFCIRDPRAVLNSILRIERFPEKPRKDASKANQKGFWGVLPPGYEEYLDKSLVEKLCWQIEMLHKIGLSYRNTLKERLILFRYEELLHDSHETVANLFASLQLSNFSEIGELIPGNFPDYSPPWPNDEGYVEEKYGENRCYMDSEITVLKQLSPLVTKLGYDASCVGKLKEKIVN
jgi:hypothetical protein